MGWLFRNGSTRRGLIEERTEGWERTNPDGLVITSTCLAHCYRGASFSGVLWSVWERTFNKDGTESSPTQRWIQCDLLRYQRDFGWGYKDMEESSGPYFFSCPIKYIRMVPIEQYGGNEEWREQVVLHHQRAAEKRRQRSAAKCQ
tara:strand:+ start:46905 stop:47339 length:435 start_codon:yes stop_codon:yes gene_type:complete